MLDNMTAWKADNYKFVGKAFDFAYNNRLNKLLAVMGTVTTNSVDYELSGNGGYGEMPLYDGHNLNEAKESRGFKTIIVPDEYELTETVSFKAHKVDKAGETRRVGAKLGNSAAMTVYLHALDVLSGAFDPTKLGGDGCPWASEVHPVASKLDAGRKRIADPDAGTYSNLIHSTLTVSAIADAQAKASRFVTPDGMPLAGEFNMLLVSPEYAEAAAKICGPNGKWRPERNPDDDTNAANPLPDLQYMVIGGGMRGFAKKQWALCDPIMMKEIFKLVYITKPTIMQTQLDNPLKDAYTAYADFGIGWGDARPIIFSDAG